MLLQDVFNIPSIRKNFGAVDLLHNVLVLN
jgi:hypothetical protein